MHDLPEGGGELYEDIRIPIHVDSVGPEEDGGPESRNTGGDVPEDSCKKLWIEGVNGLSSEVQCN